MPIYRDLPNQPYVYVVGWTRHDVWYLGCRYGRTCQPSDLWKTYFTSSRYVTAYREQHGEPDHVEVLYLGDREEVVSWEATCITDWSLHHDNRWLNRHRPGGCFNAEPGWKQPERTKAKLSEVHKVVQNRPEMRELKRRTALERWADPKWVEWHKTRSKEAQRFSYNGQSLTITEWCDLYPYLEPQQFYSRVKTGWSIEKILLTKPRPRGPNKAKPLDQIKP